MNMQSADLRTKIVDQDAITELDARRPVRDVELDTPIYCPGPLALTLGRRSGLALRHGGQALGCNLPTTAEELGDCLCSSKTQPPIVLVRPALVCVPLDLQHLSRRSIVHVPA